MIKNFIKRHNVKSLFNKKNIIKFSVLLIAVIAIWSVCAMLFEDKGTLHTGCFASFRMFKVSENGATIETEVDTPVKTVKIAKRYIKKKHMVAAEFGFNIWEYHADDCYEKVKEQFNFSDKNESKSMNYCVDIIYDGITVGCFGISKRGKIIVGKHNQSGEEIQNYDTGFDISEEKAYALAREKLGSDCSDELLRSGLIFNYNSETPRVCRWFEFRDGSKVQIDGITGEEAWSNKVKVTDGGATIWGQTRLFKYAATPNKIIDGAKKYIKQNGLDSDELYFVFCNNKYEQYIYPINREIIQAYKAQSVRENIVGFSDSDDFLYYVKVIYKNRNEENGILSGYFAINENGVVTESAHIKTVQKIAKYKRNPDIGSSKAIDLANNNADGDLRYEERFFYYNSDDEAVLAYGFLDNGKSLLCINGITGKLM